MQGATSDITCRKSVCAKCHLFLAILSLNCVINMSNTTKQMPNAFECCIHLRNDKLTNEKQHTIFSSQTDSHYEEGQYMYSSANFYGSFPNTFLHHSWFAHVQYRAWIDSWIRVKILASISWYGSNPSYDRFYKNKLVNSLYLLYRSYFASHVCHCAVEHSIVCKMKKNIE